MARPIPDAKIQAVFADTLSSPDTTLVALGSHHGVSASLASKMRRRAEDIARNNPGWSQRALTKQLIQDGWVSVRRNEYALPSSSPSRASTWRALAVIAALTGAVVIGSVVRLVT